VGALMLCASATGCTKLGEDFRTAAGPQLQAGLTAMLTGVVDGAFAVFEPGTDSTSSDSTSGGTG